MNNENTATVQTNWPLVVVGFVALAIAFSARAALSLVMPTWQEEFEWTRSFISSVMGGSLVLMAIVAPVAGWLVDKRGSKETLVLGLALLAIGCALVSVMQTKMLFIIGFGVFSALGFGLAATHVVATAVTKSFSNNQGLATGIATSGSTGGQFLVVPLLAVLLGLFSWRLSFAAIAITCALLCAYLLFWKEQRPETQSSGSSNAKSNLRDDLGTILTTPTFHWLLWSFVICGVTTTGVIETHMVPFATFCGFPPLPSATAYGLLSLVNLVGMIGAGYLADRVNRPILLGSIYVLRGASFILLFMLPGLGIEYLFLFAIFFGVVDYSTLPVTASLIASHIGLKSMGLAMGLLSAGHALGGAIGAYAGGYVFDNLSNYDWLWLGSLWLSIAAGVLVLLVPAKGKVLAT
ncbi:MFS transporter [Alphaproteobacteria bacterium]|jgi:MFS family permease|nr:MFS transporter [Alphaproteobacteria bacterium]